MNEMFSITELLQKIKSRQGAETTNLTYHEYQQKKVDWYNDMVGNLNELDGYNCELCKNKGFIAILEKDTEVHRQCKCHKIRLTLRRAQRSGLGDIITDYTFEKFKATEEWQKTLKEKAQSFCENDDACWFYIGGQVGCGKTHLCTAIAAHYIKAGREVKYMLWSEEAKKLKALVNGSSYQDEIAIYKNADVLYIDDFLKVKNGETPTPADINLAFEIINHRLMIREQITIISSEKTLDELLEYDEATMSRIYQKSGNYKINIGRDKNKNYRLKE